MDATPARVVKWTRADGSSPLDEWLGTAQDPRTRARIVQRIDRMERDSFGDRKDVGCGVHELRLDFGPGYRVYFASWHGTIIVLLGGGDKGTQAADIRTAQKLWRDLRQAGICDDDFPRWPDAAE